jgi:hypothetical protein
MKTTILTWLKLIALSPLIILGGLFCVAICTIFGTSERVPVTYLPYPKTMAKTPNPCLNRLKIEKC